ncbi:MAG: hypothetical protein ABW036_11450 [Flavitalea sp.]
MKTKLKSIIKNLLLVIGLISGPVIRAEISKSLDKQVTNRSENGAKHIGDHGMNAKQITFSEESGQRFESDDGT